MKDLVILVADKNAQFALRGAMGRHSALCTRPFDFEFRTHVGRDGGARSTGVAMLASERTRFSHALLCFDWEGSGTDKTAEELERLLDSELSAHWGGNAKSIVVTPEIDMWLWGNDNLLKEILRWPLDGSIRGWLEARGFVFDAAGKPLRPKEALEALIPVHRQPRSSTLYERTTTRISLARCTDGSFSRLRSTLQVWFPPPL